MTIKENLAYLKYFGFKLTLFKTLNTLMKKSKGKLSWKIHDLNNQVIENWIKKECNETYQKFIRGKYTNNENLNSQQQKIIKNIENNNVIWTMWWQGEEHAPEIVKACIASMRKYSNGHKVIVLDQDNYKDYVKLPDYILDRYTQGQNDKTVLNKCVLGMTHLSDVIRYYLLIQYGGIWMDATIFLTDNLNEEIFESEFITIGQDNVWYIGRGKWATFCMGCKANSLLASFVYQMHTEYWNKHKYYVNYLMLDHIIDIAYKDIPSVKRMIDNMLFGEKECLTINRNYMKSVNDKEINEFLKKQHIHKLSWKWWGNSKETEVQVTNSEGKLTWFGYFYNKYL